MSASYDLYQPGSSWLHRLDPRVKLLMTSCMSVLLVWNRNLWLMVGALVLVQLALLSAGILKQRLAAIWRVMLPTMLMVGFLWVIIYPGEGTALLEWWFIRISVGSIAEAAVAVSRLGALGLTIMAWLLSTDQTSLVRGLVSLGVPYAWGLALSIALCHIPTMASSFRTISDAQRARGLDLDQGSLLQRGRNYVPIVVAMLISSLRTSEHISRTLESRAFGISAKRTYLRDLSLRRADWVWCAGTLAVTVGWVLARILWGIGAELLSLLA